MGGEVRDFMGNELLPNKFISPLSACGKTLIFQSASIEFKQTGLKH